MTKKAGSGARSVNQWYGYGILFLLIIIIKLADPFHFGGAHELPSLLLVPLPLAPVVARPAVSLPRLPPPEPNQI